MARSGLFLVVGLLALFAAQNAEAQNAEAQNAEAQNAEAQNAEAHSDCNAPVCGCESVGCDAAFNDDCCGGCDSMGCDSMGCDSGGIGKAIRRRINFDASRLFLRMGAGGAFFQEAATVHLGGAPVGGASLVLEDNAAFLFDIGYQINDRWTFTISSGVPPQTDLFGTGPHAGVPYGRTKYAPAIFSLQYHVPLDRFVQPGGRGLLCNSNVYFGGGFHHTWFYGSKDNAVTNLDVDDAWGSAVQIGFEKMLAKRLGLYLDFKQVFLETEAHGNVGGTPMQTDVIADPSVLSGGIILRR
ncbi:MAG: OmpW family outer membrane protein [Planctomycetota bacterium]